LHRAGCYRFLHGQRHQGERDGHATADTGLAGNTQPDRAGRDADTGSYGEAGRHRGGYGNCVRTTGTATAACTTSTGVASPNHAAFDATATAHNKAFNASTAAEHNAHAAATDRDAHRGCAKPCTVHGSGWNAAAGVEWYGTAGP